MLAITTAIALSLQPYVGASNSTLDWNIARDLSGAATPNILSELSFDAVASQQLGLRGQAEFEWTRSWIIMLEGEITTSRFSRGTAFDADYFGDNRTDLYSLSRSNIVGDEGFQATLGAGFNYDLVPGRHRLAATVGYYQQDQTLNFRYGQQVVADSTVYSATEIASTHLTLQQDLDTRYLSAWEGTYLGLGYRFSQDKVSTDWQFKYQVGRYYGEGEWNLRDDLQQPRSFSHFVNTSGYEVQGSIAYQLSQQWAASLGMLYRQWQSATGVSVAFLSNGDINATRFNGVNWTVTKTWFGLIYRW